MNTRNYFTNFHSFIQSCRSLSYDRFTSSSKRVVSPIDRDLVHPLSISSSLSFPSGHPVAAYVLFLVSHHFYTSLYLSLKTCFKGSPTQDVIKLVRRSYCFIVRRIFLYPLTLPNNSSFLIRSVQLIFSITFQNFPGIYDLLSEGYKF
jgi:hypothetical protein